MVGAAELPTSVAPTLDHHPFRLATLQFVDGNDTDGGTFDAYDPDDDSASSGSSGSDRGRLLDRWQDLFVEIYKAAWPYQSPAEIGRCKVWQIAGIFQPDKAKELLDPDGEPIEPPDPEVQAARVAAFERFQLRHRPVQ